MSRVAYEIRVSGQVPDRFFEDFSHVTVVVDPGATTLRLDVADQAELAGVLDALRRAGLVLLDLQRQQSVGPPEGHGPNG